MSFEYSDEELIEQYRDLYKRLGRVPLCVDLYKDVFCASDKTFLSHFGSIKKVREKAGIEEDIDHSSKGNRKYSDRELLSKLREFALMECNGKTPYNYEIDEANNMPSVSTYKYRFGSMRKAKAMAGIQPNSKNGKKRGKVIIRI